MDIHIKTPTDEQLAAYVSNTASPEDTVVVEAWINEDPKNLDELLDMAVAASLPERQQSTVTLVPWYRRPVYWAAAAVVAVVLVASVLWYQPSSGPQEPIVADADVPSLTGVEPQISEQGSTSSTPSVTKVLEESVPGISLQREEHITATQTVAPVAQPLLELKYPRRYREVCIVGKDVTFCWQSNAVMLRLVITDAEGVVLHERNLTGQSEYSIPASVIQGQEELHWTLVASFGEGQILKREGTIIQMNE